MSHTLVTGYGTGHMWSQLLKRQAADAQVLLEPQNAYLNALGWAERSHVTAGRRSVPTGLSGVHRATPSSGYNMQGRSARARKVVEDTILLHAGVHGRHKTPQPPRLRGSEAVTGNTAVA